MLGYWGHSHVTISCPEKVISLADPRITDPSYPEIQSELESRAQEEAGGGARLQPTVGAVSFRSQFCRSKS